jgi:hypothetical protein
MSVLYIGEHIAVAVCAVTGVLAAKGKRLDLCGVILLALVTALGGGDVLRMRGVLAARVRVALGDGDPVPRHRHGVGAEAGGDPMETPPAAVQASRARQRPAGLGHMCS